MEFTCGRLSFSCRLERSSCACGRPALDQPVVTRRTIHRAAIVSGRRGVQSSLNWSEAWTDEQFRLIHSCGMAESEPKVDAVVRAEEQKRPAASETFVNILAGLVEHQDVNSILEQQVRMLSRFEKTNEKLERFNSLEAGRFHSAMEQFRAHTRVLLEMKKDLDSVFRRIRLLRNKLSRQYPKLFAAYEEEEGERTGEEEEEETDEGVH